MATALDVCRYIRSTRAFSGEVQAQKLVYYCQAWSLAWDGRPLFPERVEAWTMGPVVPAIRHRTDEDGDFNLTDSEKATVDAVVSHYGQSHGQALGAQSHSQAPWLVARGETPEGVPSSAEITHESMRHWATEEALAGHGPQRLRTATTDVEDAEVLAVAGVNADRWQRVLELLAR